MRGRVRVAGISILPLDERLIRGGSIDLPATGSSHGSRGLELAGWALLRGSSSGRVEFIVGGAHRSSAPLDFPRQDVFEHYRNDPATEFCGFSGWVPLEPADREIFVQVLREDGARAPLGSVRLEPDLRERPAPDRSLILAYHRIADVAADPWSIAVSPSNFEEQMEVLRREFSVVALGRFSESASRGAGPRSVVAVTFDDGYADNLSTAKPILEKQGIPATVFVASGALGDIREFWWDELDRIFLQPGKIPESLRLTIDGQPFEEDFGPAASYGDSESARDGRWRFGRKAPTPRQRVYGRLWETLQPLAELPRRRAMEALRAWSGGPSPARPTHRTLRSEELIELEAGGLVEIGAHTVTHPALSRLPVDAQRSEIEECASSLEDLFGSRPARFAYPYGDFAEETETLVREAGFREAMTTAGTVFGPGCDPMRLPRILVGDWNGDEFAARLKGLLGE